MKITSERLKDTLIEQIKADREAGTRTTPDMESRILADAEVIEAAQYLEQVVRRAKLHQYPAVQGALTAFREAMKKREDG